MPALRCLPMSVTALSCLARYRVYPWLILAINSSANTCWPCVNLADRAAKHFQVAKHRAVIWLIDERPVHHCGLWQGRRESNSQPPVLETGALPIELRPCATATSKGSRVYSIILVTTPEPTVRPPSRIAKRTPSSIAIGLCNSMVTLTLSPGMHISAPTRFAVPVTSVVRK